MQREDASAGTTPPPPGGAGVVVGQVGRTFRGLKGSHVGAEAGQWLVIHSHSLDGWARVSHPDGRQGLFPYSCIDESSLRPAPHLLSLKLMGKDGGPPPPLPPPRAARAPPAVADVLPAEPLMSATPASTAHTDPDTDTTTTTTAPQVKDKEKDDDTSDNDGDEEEDTSSDDSLGSNSDGDEDDGDDDDGAPPAAAPLPARDVPRESLAGERRGTRYLRTDELEQLYSALFRRSLHHPHSSAEPSSSSSTPRTPPAPAVARSSSSSPPPSPKPAAAAAAAQSTTATATEAPVPSVAAERIQPRAELEKKRLRLVEELIESEELYLRHLHIIQQVYLPPLVEKGVLVGEQERFLSSNVGLFADMHREFHSLLFRRFRRYSYATPQPQPPPIGDIFLTMKSYFGNYHRFCSGHAAALAALHKLNESSSAFRRCIRNIEASEAARGLTLAELLISPVERICKYPRFLSELLELTPRTAVDYELLRAAQEQFVAVVKASNEAAARGANHQRMRQIAGYFSRQHLRDIMGSSRNFIHEGRLYAFDPPGSGGGGGGDQQSAQTGKPVVVFLFSDIMVVADRLKSAKLLDPAKRHKRCFSSMHRIPLASSRIINVVAADNTTADATSIIAQQQQRVSMSTESPTSPLSTDAPSPRGSTAGGDDDDHPFFVDNRQQQTNSDNRKAKGSLRRWRKDSDSTPDVQSQQTHHLHRFELQALWRSADEEHVLRRYLFGAESEDEKRMWFRSIQKLINHALLRQMNALPAGEAGDDYHHDTNANTNGDDTNDDGGGDEDEEESRGSSRRKPTRRAASFSSASHSNSSLLAKAKASTTFRRKVERLRSSDQSSSSGSGKSPPASPNKKKAAPAKKDLSPRKHHTPPPPQLDATTTDHQRQPINDQTQPGGGLQQQQLEGMEEGGAARDEVSLLRDEIEQLKLQLHTLRPFTGSLVPWDPSPAAVGDSATEPSAAGSSSASPSASLIIKRRQRRSQSATT